MRTSLYLLIFLYVLGEKRREEEKEEEESSTVRKVSCK